MLRKFLPNNFDFFELFEKQVGYAVDAASTFRTIAETGILTENLYNKIQSLEHQGDEITHTIINELNKTFITPFDREDIYNLAKELDDVIDMFNTITNRMRVYKISGVNPILVEFASVIQDSVKTVQSAIVCLRNVKQHGSIMDSCVEINRLENVGDTMRDKALGELFDKEKDPIAIIKWKEIYTDAETILDICEDVAHIIETILVKQA
ncbi:MAG: DUF47 family protein [Candidatus Omnitrophica bacterium]|nr:DUF47 family protein [Candidatus Omnitrophota bacterium]MCM8816930.1 DUF47 family protein [Candidatus Omnitrophota bacterium]